MLRVRFLSAAVAAALLPAIVFAQAAPPQNKEKVTIKTEGTAKAITTVTEPTKPTRFDEIDTNKDGFVSRDEFTASEKKRFSEFDTNHDGKIDPKEVASSPPLMERNMRTAERMTKQWDANGDGVVTREEFDKSAQERFDKQDKDKTGKLAKRPIPPGMQPVKPGQTIIKPPAQTIKPPATQTPAPPDKPKD
ncbi:MAG: EF-hand domain-containing protein [Rhodanobacteraceae bacterium]